MVAPHVSAPVSPRPWRSALPRKLAGRAGPPVSRRSCGPGLLCLVSCAIGLVFTMEAGNYWFDIFNDYAATLSLLLIVLVETVAVCYVYGLRR